MTAKIIPFARRIEGASSPAPRLEMPPTPVLSTVAYFHGRLWHCSFLGTKESLIAWQITTESEFPQGRKRTQYNQSPRPTVETVHGSYGVFRVRFHFTDEHVSARSATEALIKEIQEGCGDFEAAAGKGLRLLYDLRRSLFFSDQGPNYDQAKVEAFDEHSNKLEKIIAAALKDKHTRQLEAAQS